MLVYFIILCCLLLFGLLTSAGALECAAARVLDSRVVNLCPFA